MDPHEGRLYLQSYEAHVNCRFSKGYVVFAFQPKTLKFCKLFLTVKTLICFNASTSTLYKTIDYIRLFDALFGARSLLIRRKANTGLLTKFLLFCYFL